jgi:peptidase M1-like protein
MHRPVLLATLLCAAPLVPIRAQVADSSPFRPLALPTPSATRAASGAPGRGYWQNRADYALEARLDTTREELRGSGRIRYVNNSPDSLTFVWLQLDQDIFAERSINRRVPSPPLLFGGTPFDMMVKEPGGLTMDTLRTSRGLTGTQRYDTMLRLDLERALGPGDTVDITTAWHFRVPVNGVARMGRDGRLYEIAQWYPRLAVCDDVHGWNTMPYVGPGEFYLEYGDFQVRVTVPASFIVAATGELQNAESVLTADQRQRLARARGQAEPVAVITAEEAGDAARTRPSAQGTATWSFSAHNVRDFAFAAAPNFRWEAVRADAGGAGPRLVQVYYRPGAANWQYAIRMAKHAIESFSSRWFPYAYPQASVIEGPIQGMEYPMIVFVPADTSAHGLSWTLMHELGHEWFPMMVGSDERRYPWMDEGFNSFIDLYTVSDWYRGRDDQHADSILNGPLTTYPSMAIPGREQPLSTNPMESHDLYWTAYQKPALMLRLLREEVIGADVFDRAMSEYGRRWQGRHPQPADFFRTIENVSGRNLDWFWREWIYSTARLDQSVDSVTVDGDTTRIVLHNRREMLMPAEVRITFDSGAAETRQLPIEMWNYGPWHAMLVATHARHVTAVEVDPRHAYPDVDRANNSWSAAVAEHREVAAPVAVAAAAAAVPAATSAPAPPTTEAIHPADTGRPGAAPAAAAGAAAGAAVADATGVTSPEAAMEIMRTDLINLAHAERAYFERSGRYTTELAALGFLPSRGITVTVGYATEQGWRALARHAGTGARCATFGGNATPPSASAQPEVPVCR